MKDPVDRAVRAIGARDERSTIAAWRTLTTLPLEYLRRTRK